MRRVACLTCGASCAKPKDITTNRSAVTADRNTRPLPSPWSCAALRAATAASFYGTFMGSLFFVREMLNFLPLQFTMPRDSLY